MARDCEPFHQIGRVLEVDEDDAELAAFGPLGGAEDDEEHEENAVVQREDAKGAASIKVFEVVAGVQRIEEDSGDEEAREGEEEIDPNPASCADLGNEIHQARAGLRGRPEQVVDEHHRDRKSTNAVQRCDMFQAVAWSGDWGNLRGSGHSPEESILSCGCRNSAKKTPRTFAGA